MARTALTVQDLAASGITPSYTAAIADGHSVHGDGKTFLHVKNSGGSACTVTIQTPATVSGLAVAEQTVSVPATTGDKMIGPFPPNTYNQVDGDVYIDYSVTTGVTVAAIRM